MKNADITDPLFREAVEAIDAGNVPALQGLLNTHPQLVSQRLDAPQDGYFSHPYLLWFVADNPIRQGRLPANIAQITQVMLPLIRTYALESIQHQLDYTLGLVVTGSTPRECGVQIELMDVLLDAGAQPGSGHGALAHGNVAAAGHLIERGGKLTLTTAICLNRPEDRDRLANESTAADRQIALIAAAFYGMVDQLAWLISTGVDVNGYIEPSSGFHAHATALHQAVYSGSLESVKVLVEAGARLDVVDRAYGGTPIGWAGYMLKEAVDEPARQKYAQIEAFLRSQVMD